MRLFLGTLLGDANQRFYADFARAVTRRHGRLLHGVPEGSAHLTYLFSGDADDGCVDALAEVVRRALAACPPFDIELGPPRLLIAGPRPRLVCADVRRGAGEFTALALGLLQSVQQAKLPLTPVGSKAPHVTLLRFSKQARRSDARTVAETLAHGPWARETRTDRVSQVQVIVSTLMPSGPVYEVRAEAALTPA